MIFIKVATANCSFYYNNQELTEVKKYNFLGTVIDSKGCFKRAAQKTGTKSPQNCIFS